MVLKLPELQGLQIVDAEGKPTSYFTGLWTRMKTLLESHVSALELAALEATLQAGIDTVTDLTADAQASADAAAASADAINTIAALTNSYVSDDIVITSDDADNDIHIGAHTRLYGDGTSVAVSAGTVAGGALTDDMLYAIYYDDAARAGGAVTYHATTDFAAAGYSTTNPNRHFVGSVRTPNGAGDTTGVGNTQPAYIPDSFVIGNLL